MNQSQQFQVILQKQKQMQVDVPVPTSYVSATAGALLQEVSEQVGIPVENPKLMWDGGRGSGYPTHFITNMVQPIYHQYKHWVTVDEDNLLKKETGTGINLFMEDMTKLLDDPETSDCTLRCGSKSFKVHKTILGARFNVFRAMFLSGMKETVEGVVVIKDVDEKAMEEVLYYLYTGKLSGKEFVVKSLCYAANKYELDYLIDLICEKIRAARLKAQELADVFISAEMFNKKEMYDIAMNLLKNNKGVWKDKKFQEKLKEWPDLLYKIIISIV